MTFTTKNAKDLYGLDHWGGGLFSINKLGNLTIHPNMKKDISIDIMEVIEEIKASEISFPLVLRFHDILRNQVKLLNKTFADVIKSANYKGKYTGVYPLKVNQLREVTEEILKAGKPYNYGLEVGSKAELLAALVYNDNPQALTICNGSKDINYLELALLGNEIGKNVIIVIEKYSELLLINDICKSQNISHDFSIGLRVKLSAKGSGRWIESGGERAKFGLTTSELIKAVRFLQGLGKSHQVKLLHFHIGSQITDVRMIKDAITEGARVYTELVKLGLDLKYLDVGGGLGIDYDGSKSIRDSSINYSMQDYVEDVIYIVGQTCDLNGIKHPDIISESGRAVAAKHSCVIFKVVGSNKADNYGIDEDISDEHILVSNMRELWQDLNEQNFQETFNDALQKKEETINAFKLGVVSLKERAIVEKYFWQMLSKIKNIISTLEFVPKELSTIYQLTSEQYICNCSFFQSVPDAWSIGQLFPVIPLHKLNTRPTVLASLVDITCDSDGKIDRFINHTKSTHDNSILLHELDGSDYFLGIFFTGAYQDVLGDMHNLFGKLNEVHICHDKYDPTDFYIEEIIDGDLTKDALVEMQYHPVYMIQEIKKLITQKVQKGTLTPKRGVRLATLYEKALEHYTYLN